MTRKMHAMLLCTAALLVAACSSAPKQVVEADIAKSAVTAALLLAEQGETHDQVHSLMESCASRCSHECSGIDYPSCILHCSTPNCHPSCCGCKDGSTGCDGCSQCGPGDQACVEEDAGDAV